MCEMSAGPGVEHVRGRIDVKRSPQATHDALLRRPSDLIRLATIDSRAMPTAMMIPIPACRRHTARSKTHSRTMTAAIRRTVHVSHGDGVPVRRGFSLRPSGSMCTAAASRCRIAPATWCSAWKSLQARMFKLVNRSNSTSRPPSSPRFFSRATSSRARSSAVSDRRSRPLRSGPASSVSGLPADPGSAGTRASAILTRIDTATRGTLADDSGERARGLLARGSVVPCP